MKDLLDKLSSYNIFNYLFPGTLFVCLAKVFTGYDLIQENVIIGVFLYYFIGLSISRFGSLVIEPILKKTKIIRFVDYKRFVKATKKDEKIELFSEINNTFRTLLSLFMILLLLKGYSTAEAKYSIPPETTFFVLTILIVLMFVFAYRKQSQYVVRRIEASEETEKEKED